MEKITMDTSDTHFSINYTFFDDTKETEISMFVNEKNILGSDACI